MDPLSRYGERRRGSISAQETSGIQLLAATFRQLRKPNQQLLIPLTVFIGMEQALIGADFTQVSRNFYDSIRFSINCLHIAGICFMCIGNPSNRLRDDSFRRS